MTLCREQGFDFFLAQQTILLGWALRNKGTRNGDWRRCARVSRPMRPQVR